MTTPLPGDVALGRLTETVFSSLPGQATHRARPVAADDAVLGVVAAARAVEVATRPAADAPDMGRCLRAEAMAALDALFRALEVVDGR